MRPSIGHPQSGQRPPVAVWTAAQTAAFLAHIEGHVLYPLFRVVALLGLRRGEIIAVRWSDVDFAAGTVTVCRQIQEREGRAVVCLPKSERSGRTVALDHATLTVLRRLHADWVREGGGVATDGWVFAHAEGRHWSPSYVTHVFGRLVREAGLPPIRFHDLRHGAASLSLAAGNELKVVQAILGHESMVLTADTYTSVLPCIARKATAALVRRLIILLATEGSHNQGLQLISVHHPSAATALGDLTRLRNVVARQSTPAARTATSCWVSTSATGYAWTPTPARSDCSATPTAAAGAVPGRVPLVSGRDCVARCLQPSAPHCRE
jgi:hypothetical protein